ncbi:Serine--tRNA ligase [Scenedesmus sp. PABB004]|nr:Serine--tRNA ligase [Scenedesmus sp. PABB004]
MLDINEFRVEKGGDPERVRESQRRRFADVGLVDKVVQLDADWRNARFALDQVKKEFNALNKQIGELRKAKQDAGELQERTKAMKATIAELEAKEGEIAAARDAALLPIGNLVHDSVPVSDNEDNNAVVRTWGEPRQEEKLYNHVDLVQLLDIVDLEAGTSVAGGRGYYLTNEGPLLNQALINAALHFAYRRGFKPVHTPFFMRQDIMAECAQLSQFDEELYKVTGEGDDKYLIATSEQTLCAMHRKDWIHQFEKVEQFVICSPEGNQSWEVMEEMLGNAEEFYQALGLPYRVVNIVSGELNNAAAKKYDLEAWFPASKTHRELVSCSNCTDYQSRRLDIRVRTPKTAPGAAEAKPFVHMLNSTLTATQRTLCCVLENYQTPTGVRVPPALQPFLPGIDFIPFRKALDAKGKLVDLPKPAPAGAPAAGGEAMSTS